jgi:hypothetical protein
MARLGRIILALSVLAGVAGLAYVRQAHETTGAKMVAAADRFLGSLTAAQKAKTVFEFDDKERTNWHFTPQQNAQKRPTRKGLPLVEMSAEQQDTARNLLKAATSAEGFETAKTIMSLENLLRELEKGGAMVRNPEWYFFAVFGTPSSTGKWGWRVEGHHLALNFTLEGNKIISATPAFFGANPATIKDGPQKGKRTLAEAEDLAKELFNSLEDAQHKIAYQEMRFPEIQEELPAPKVGEPKGLAAARMNEKQRGLLMRILQSYAGRMPADIAETEMAEAKANFEQVHFAYSGGVEPGKPHTYRVHGPTFVIEFLNEQADSARNPANHIHSAWRSLKGDFGLSQ